MKEIWKPIRGYETEYEISNYGEVKSIKKGIEFFLSVYLNVDGYVSVWLYKKDKRKLRPVHRLVAEHFLPKKEKDKIIVIHKDNDKDNNYVGNLMWVSKSSIRSKKRASYRKPAEHIIIRTDKQGVEIEKYDNAAEASRKTGIDRGSIEKVIKGRRKTAGGFKWVAEKKAV